MRRLEGRAGRLELRGEPVAAQRLGILLDVVVIDVQVDQAEQEEAGDADDRAEDEPPVDRVQGLVAGAVGARLDAVGADDRADHADGADQEREDHADVAEAGYAQDHRGDDRHLVALEDVGGHPGAVADVVADVVGDRRGVARVVLGDPRLDLAHQVGTDVGRLGEDAAADPHEQGQQRAAEAEAEQDLVGVLAVGHEDDRAAQQAEAVGEHAGDRAGAVAELQRRAVAGPRGGRDAEVTPDGQAHPDKTDQPGERRPHEERQPRGPARRAGSALALGGGVEDAVMQEHQRDDRLELAGEIGVGPLPDRPRRPCASSRSPGRPRAPGRPASRHRPGPPPPPAERANARAPTAIMGILQEAKY